MTPVVDDAGADENDRDEDWQTSRRGGVFAEFLSERTRLLGGGNHDEDDDDVEDVEDVVGASGRRRRTGETMRLPKWVLSTLMVGTFVVLVVVSSSLSPSSSPPGELLGVRDERIKALSVPLFVMGDFDPNRPESEMLRSCFGYLGHILKTYTAMHDEDINKVVIPQSATFPSRWPETKQIAEKAVRFITDDSSLDLSDFFWLSAVGSRDKVECGPRCEETGAHHFGCLLTHMRIWQRAIDMLPQDADKFVVWESDGFSLNSVSPLDYNNLAYELPADADLVWLKPDARPTGQFIKRFKSRATSTDAPDIHVQLNTMNQTDVYLYRFDKLCGWSGTPSYMMTKSGAKKILNFIKKSRTVDMIDAWLAGHCIKRCSDEETCMNLNCYSARTERVPWTDLGGFIPDWYDVQDDYPMREVDSDIVESIKTNAREYNVRGCARDPQFKGFVPTPFTNGPLADEREAISGCVSTVAPPDQYHPCSDY